jgi:hypothetical protein
VGFCTHIYIFFSCGRQHRGSRGRQSGAEQIWGWQSSMVEYYESHHDKLLLLQLIMRSRGAAAIEIVLEVVLDVEI